MSSIAHDVTSDLPWYSGLNRQHWRILTASFLRGADGESGRHR